jgi:hypothetical protein
MQKKKKYKKKNTKSQNRKQKQTNWILESVSRVIIK